MDAYTLETSSCLWVFRKHNSMLSVCSLLHLHWIYQWLLYLYIMHTFCPLPQVDGVSLQGCSEQRAMEVLRRTGPLVRLKLLRKAIRLSRTLPPVPPLQHLRHSHSFHESSLSKWGLNQIQETGDLWKANTFSQCYHERSIIIGGTEKIKTTLMFALKWIHTAQK